MAGVATAAHARGRGGAGARGRGGAPEVCGFLVRAGRAAHPAVGLIVDDANPLARRLDHSLHLTYHPLSATAPCPGPPLA